MKLAKLFLNTLLLIISLSLSAQLKLPAIISDNLILQQNTKVALWGWASPGEKITINTSWNNIKTEVIADANSKWLVYVSTTRAGGPYTITFSATNTITVNNVLLGEVWLASGQSNMEFFVGKTNNYKGISNHDELVKEADFPDIRTFDVPNKVSDTALTDTKAIWKICSPATIDSFSAVAFFFAKEIKKATGLPVAIINATWGGTPAESWTRKDVLQKDKDLNQILVRYQQALDIYPAENEKYRTALASWRADTSKLKGSAPTAPMGPNNNKSPYKLYNGMIAPIQPYTIKGVIWYQGESNADYAYQYRKLFPAMIQNWRDDWRNQKLPFYFVQISPHRGQNPEIRDAQLFVHRTVPYTGMAVTTDNGDSMDIHPRNKELVGKRLALWALYNDYGKKEITVSGPLYKAMKVEGNKIRIFFDYDKGLVAEDGELKEFTIAGEDQNFLPAQAKIEGNRIVVWNETVKQPKAVRFAWKNVPHPNLFNAARLPASPFRTDNWKLVTQDKN